LTTRLSGGRLSTCGTAASCTTGTLRPALCLPNATARSRTLWSRSPARRLLRSELRLPSSPDAPAASAVGAFCCRLDTEDGPGSSTYPQAYPQAVDIHYAA